MKKNILKKILSIVLVSVVGVSVVGCESKNEKKADSKIIIGLDDTFVPMGFKDDSGEIVGFDVDLAKEAGKRMRIDVEFQSIDWTLKEQELNSKNIDAIWNGYSITDERKEVVDFTEPYLKNRQVIITVKNSEINNKEDLIGKSVAVQNSSSSQDAVEKDSEFVTKLKGGELVLFDSNNDAFMDLQAGRCDAIVADEIMARYYINEIGNEKFKVLSEDFGDEVYGIGIRKDDSTLKDKLNDALSKMREDGTMSDISKKWFGKDIINK